ncbi:transglutaminase-like cysteine peptidase [Chitinibacteraceae bacterium HSL-7]
MRLSVAPLLFLVALLTGWLYAASDEARMRTRIEQLFGAQSVPRLSAWRDTVRQATRDENDLGKLRRVNDFFNRTIRFSSDQQIWRNSDYWATPLETLGKAAGDCEDFTIGKYFSLIEAGVDAARLRLTYVKARIGGPDSRVTEAHMVLTYYATPKSEPLVLDNLIREIRPASQRPDLLPVFSFNRDGVYIGTAAPAPVERVARWTDLLLRMRTDGYEP